MYRGGSYPVFDLDFARIGVITCYDGFFPEPARAMSLQGAELLLWPNGRQGMLEPFLISSFLFHNTMTVVATAQIVKRCEAGVRVSFASFRAEVRRYT